MRIGELAELAGTSTRALRHYEDQGLLAARRLANGYRDYSTADLRAVEEIRALLAAGFALEETRPFVECLRAGNPAGDACPDSVEGYRRKISQIDDYVTRLLRAREQLTAQLTAAQRRLGPNTGPDPDPGTDDADQGNHPGADPDLGPGRGPDPGPRPGPGPGPGPGPAGRGMVLPRPTEPACALGIVPPSPLGPIPAHSAQKRTTGSRS